MKKQSGSRWNFAVRISGLLLLCLAMGAISLVAPLAAQSRKSDSAFTELYLFNSYPTGVNPIAGLVRDSDGNLYGTTSVGGNVSSSACTQQFNGCGVVFKLDRQGHYSVLYEFSFADGSQPWSSLVRDSKGNLYGITEFGGTGSASNCGNNGCGVVFKLSADGTETVLHNFTGGTDGSAPQGGLIMDGAGNLYSATVGGGTDGSGTVFKIDSTGNYTLLYSFTGGADGGEPDANLIMDASGNLYGTTQVGGSSSCKLSPFTTGCGAIFKLSQAGNETVLFTFTGENGADPNSGLAMDRQGSLYGAAGTVNFNVSQGMIFKLDVAGNLTVIYTAQGFSPSGGSPVLDADGNIYDTDRNQEAFKLSPGGVFTILHTFAGGLDGAFPSSGVILDSSGNIFGTAQQGGSAACTNGAIGCGVVFQIGRPESHFCAVQ